MKRPAFQFYPADWRNNAKLRRCSEAARGAWMDVLCVLHDSDEYGVCRWPLVDLARAAGVSLKLVKELVAKDVLKGADKGAAPYIYTPRHAGKDGEPVMLVEANDGPCWYCSRFVRDEWVRQRRGQATQFTAAYQPARAASARVPTHAASKATPKGGLGTRQGDGATSASTFTSTESDSVPDGTDAGAALPVNALNASDISSEPSASPASSISYARSASATSTKSFAKPAVPLSATSPAPKQLLASSASNASTASQELTPVQALFQIATPWLIEQGVSDKSARSLLGAARKQLGDANAWALASDCMREQPHEPASWIAAAINARMKVRAIAGKSVPKAENFDAVDYGQSGRL